MRSIFQKAINVPWGRLARPVFTAGIARNEHSEELTNTQLTPTLAVYDLREHLSLQSRDPLLFSSIHRRTRTARVRPGPRKTSYLVVGLSVWLMGKSLANFHHTVGARIHVTMAKQVQ